MLTSKVDRQQVYNNIFKFSFIKEETPKTTIEHAY